MKTTKRLTTITITISVLFLLIAAFLHAGPYLSPKTFQGSPEEKYKKYRTVTELFFYTGLFGLVDGIYRRRRINRTSQATEKGAPPKEKDAG
jgi:hypothetical protein